MQGRRVESARSHLRTINGSLDTIVDTLVETREVSEIASPFVIQTVQGLQTSIELEVREAVRLVTNLRRVQWATAEGLAIEMPDEDLFSEGEQGARIESEDELDFDGNLSLGAKGYLTSGYIEITLRFFKQCVQQVSSGYMLITFKKYPSR